MNNRGPERELRVIVVEIKTREVKSKFEIFCIINIFVDINVKYAQGVFGQSLSNIGVSKSTRRKPFML